MTAYNQSDWLFVIGLRRAHIKVTHEGKIEIEFEESVDHAAKRLRDYIIKEADVVDAQPQPSSEAER
jgi:hypothetical protein